MNLYWYYNFPSYLKFNNIQEKKVIRDRQGSRYGIFVSNIAQKAGLLIVLIDFSGKPAKLEPSLVRGIEKTDQDLAKRYQGTLLNQESGLAWK